MYLKKIELHGFKLSVVLSNFLIASIFLFLYLEKQIAPLKKQKEKAEVFLTLKEKLTSIEVNVLVHEVSE